MINSTKELRNRKTLGSKRWKKETKSRRDRQAMAGATSVAGSGSKKRKWKRVNVAMEGVSETADHVAPIVGYFPSGFDPHGHANGDPKIKVFRNKRRPNRLELVVSPSDSSVDFVGRSYAGEAAVPQICNYAVGVLDKESQTLKIVPIASNKILRLEPRLKGNSLVETEVSEGLAEESVGTNKVERKVRELTLMYGTKKDRDSDKRWKSFFSQRNDASTDEHINNINHETDEGNDVLEDAVESIPRNIPPHDLSADTPDKAYHLDEIIPIIERDDLFDILEALESGTDISPKSYPTFVYNRRHKLREIKDQKEKGELACILSYISHLCHFWDRQKHEHFEYLKIPRASYQNFARTFLDPNSIKLTAEKKELMIGYILVLTLFVDSFQTDPTDIAKDLKMTTMSLKPYFVQLGCKGKHVFNKPTIWNLTAPLRLPEIIKPSRRNK
ncbi:hypothetical protein ZIOFF_048666 [Zingiber officinale]|uniref:DNA-directed RNA polymerase I subunit rpa49 n=2 Tax=Zingiber officinale TaxID=94328 RepID=A0A8J5FRI7_ZINOF|nr:hypothetical protein ZIOFF_048666 [Zingiber officinale]